jgi:hypothetical protein
MNIKLLIYRDNSDDVILNIKLILIVHYNISITSLTAMKNYIIFSTVKMTTVYCVMLFLDCHI